MTEIITLADNFIGKEDREKLECFAAHIIAHDRATHWQWRKDTEGGVSFEITPVGADKRLTVHISRNRELDSFYARDATQLIASGALEHVVRGVRAILYASSW